MKIFSNTFRRRISRPTCAAHSYRKNNLIDRLRSPALTLLSIALLITPIACSQPSSSSTAQLAASSPATSPSPAAAADLTPLFSHIWQVSRAPSQPAPGSLYVFLPNGTLLQTSCVETYRIATWTIDKATPRVLQVSEDGRLAYTATIAELSNTTLKLEQTLVRSSEKREITLTAVEQEFVCPDLPK